MKLIPAAVGDAAPPEVHAHPDGYLASVKVETLLEYRKDEIKGCDAYMAEPDQRVCGVIPVACAKLYLH